jgi:hypothetical protein
MSLYDDVGAAALAYSAPNRLQHKLDSRGTRNVYRQTTYVSDWPFALLQRRQGFTETEPRRVCFQ